MSSCNHENEDTSLPVLEGKDLRIVHYGAPILDIDNISLNEGEVLSLVGPNGAGKSSLLSALCLLAGSFSGSVFFKGKKVGGEMSSHDYRKRIAMVFQEPLLFNMSVFENVASGLKFRKIKKPEIKRIVEENLERFGIVHLKERSVKNISGGEAQRVSLSRALAINPDILFLDEPFSALDPPTREALISDFEDILGSSRTTTVFATHDRIEAVRLSDRIAVMDKGRIIQTGRPDEVINHPINEFVASFVGVETILRGEVTQCSDGLISVSVSGNKIEAVGDYSKGDIVMLCIRPENVTVSANRSTTHTSARNIFQGVIEKITPLGLFYRVDMDCGFPIVAYVTGNSVEEISLVHGKKIEVSFKATAVHVLKAKG